MFFFFQLNFWVLEFLKILKFLYIPGISKDLGMGHEFKLLELQ